MANKTLLTIEEIETTLREKPGRKAVDLPLDRIEFLMSRGYGSWLIQKVLEREGYKASRTTVARRMKELREENP